MSGRWMLLALLLSASACAGPLDRPAAPVALDEPYFRCRVQPIVTKWCGQLACHGDGNRHFRVFSRGRMRMDPTESLRASTLRPEEGAQNYADASALVTPGDPDHSLLLLKPLAIAGGGRFHRASGIDGNVDVFPDRDDRDYLVLAHWIEGTTDDPLCVEPGSDQ